MPQNWVTFQGSLLQCEGIHPDHDYDTMTDALRLSPVTQASAFPITSVTVDPLHQGCRVHLHRPPPSRAEGQKCA